MVRWLGTCHSIPGSRVQIPGHRVAESIIYRIPANDVLISEIGKGSKNPGEWWESLRIFAWLID